MSYGSRNAGNKTSGSGGSNKNQTQPNFDKSKAPTGTTRKLKEGAVTTTRMPTGKNKNEFGY